MKNKLGHDNDSEIITIIARLRENKFNITSYDDNDIIFDIVLTYRSVVPVPNTRTEKIRYTIHRYPNGYSYIYHIEQLNGIDSRLIPFTDGYIIWGLLEESVAC